MMKKIAVVAAVCARSCPLSSRPANPNSPPDAASSGRKRRTLTQRIDLKVVK
jgi:hypothetical protein